MATPSTGFIALATPSLRVENRLRNHGINHLFELSDSEKEERNPEDDPQMLPGGALVCREHKKTICHDCCVDYSRTSPRSAIHDVSDNGRSSDDDDPFDEENFRWSQLGQSVTEHNVGPNAFLEAAELLRNALFGPPSPEARPDTLFRNKYPLPVAIPGCRFVRKSNHKERLIYTDGACLNNGQSNPRAGCAFYFGREEDLPSEPASKVPRRRLETRSPSGNAHNRSEEQLNKVVSFRLETKGPSGQIHQQTSNRAELRAVIAVLGFRFWKGEGASRLVIATDSEYVVLGATKWVQNWLQHGWQTAKHQAVKNRDLWEKLLSEVYRQSLMGVQVLFWRIPREWNEVADKMAKEAAALPAVEAYCRITGAGI